MIVQPENLDAIEIVGIDPEYPENDENIGIPEEIWTDDYNFDLQTLNIMICIDVCALCLQIVQEGNPIGMRKKIIS